MSAPTIVHPDPEVAAILLRAHPDYRVLRRFQPRAQYATPTDGTELRVGLYVDCETTSLDTATARIIELAIVPFEFDRDGTVYHVYEGLSSFNDPGIPIPPEVTALTGITDEQVRGHRIDWAQVDALVHTAALVIAHHAAYDRPSVRTNGQNSGAYVVCTTGEITHALTHEGHDASEDGTGRGTPIIAFNETGHEKWTREEIAGSLNAHEAKEPHTLRSACAMPDLAGTLDSREHGGGFPGTDGACAGHVVPSAGIPRRLTPLECERLMGWPDGWTDIPDAKGKPASDAARYKACGNGVVSSVPAWIGARLVACHTAMLDGAS